MCPCLTAIRGLDRAINAAYATQPHPPAGMAQSDEACVPMLAQARRFEPVARERDAALLRALGHDGASVSRLLEDPLLQLRLQFPTTLAHPLLTRWNLRPIRSADDLWHVMAPVRGSAR